ncbi:unnamed protein product [Effrenium voratum]|nr:unnamed protein product [Effrenium voratum]
MPVLQGGDWYYTEGEKPGPLKEPEQKAENKPGHRPLGSYQLPKWVYHPERANRRIVINKEDYFGMAADGLRNFDLWNVAHVAAYHDDLKLLSLATLEQCMEPNRWGMTPMHMTGLGQHPYGPSLCVLWELIQLGAADPEALNSAEQTPWHIAQRMQKPTHLKKWEKAVFKGGKPDEYEAKKQAQLRPRGKYARALGLEPVLREDTQKKLPVCLVFPGQGSQCVGMLRQQKDLPAVRQMLSKAKEILGYDLEELLMNGPEDKLAQTKHCQPAMYIAALAAFEQLKLEEEDKATSQLVARVHLSFSLPSARAPIQPTPGEGGAVAESVAMLRWWTALVKHMTRRQHWQLALWRLQNQLKMKLKPDLLLLNAAASSLATGWNWPRCFARLAQLRDLGFSTDAFSTGAVLKAAVGARAWRQERLRRDASSLAARVLSHGVAACDRWSARGRPTHTPVIERSLEVANNLMAALPWPQTLALLRQSLVRRFEPSHTSFVTVTSLCRRVGMWEQSLHYAHEDRSLALLVLSDCSRLQPELWASALDTISFSAAVSACEKGLRWQVALHTLGTAARRIRPDRTLVNAGISAQGVAGASWRHALMLMLSMRPEATSAASAHHAPFVGLEPDVVSLNAALSATEKAARWRSSLQLSRLAYQKSLEADDISFNALLAACHSAGLWQQVLALGDCDCDDLGLRLALEAQVRAGGRRRALELLARMDQVWMSILRNTTGVGRDSGVGLSVGEFAALTCAGVFDFETGLRLIKARAEAMDFEVSGARPGSKAQGMCLVVGLEKAEVEKKCKGSAGKGETCQIAACLFSRAFSVSGSLAAVQTFMEKAQAAGALQCTLLKLSGAFHTPEMADVRNILVKELDAVKSKLMPPRCMVYSNASAKAIGPHCSTQDIVKALADQMVSPVLWEQSMQNAIRDGCTEFYELGPGSQLKGIMKRIDGKIADKMCSISV